MKVLLLSPYPERISKAFDLTSDEVVTSNDRVDEQFVAESRFDWIVSYGYRYVLKGGILERFRCKIINLHISYLPWNGGADPNLWSLLDDTPKGVTIHLIDEGIDTGDILAQRHVDFAASDTLRTSYDKLRSSIEALFMETWPLLRVGAVPAAKQAGTGSYHRSKDKERVLEQLPLGWETRVADVIELGRKLRTERITK